jgi:hypothetical protein
VLWLPSQCGPLHLPTCHLQPEWGAGYRGPQMLRGQRPAQTSPLVLTQVVSLNLCQAASLLLLAQGQHSTVCRAPPSMDSSYCHHFANRKTDSVADVTCLDHTSRARWNSKPGPQQQTHHIPYPFILCFSHFSFSISVAL